MKYKFYLRDTKSPRNCEKKQNGKYYSSATFEPRAGSFLNKISNILHQQKPHGKTSSNLI
jgi:hypothetical protein